MTRLVLIVLVITGLAAAAFAAPGQCRMAPDSMACCCAPRPDREGEDRLSRTPCCRQVCAPAQHPAPPAGAQPPLCGGASEVADAPADGADPLTAPAAAVAVALRAIELGRATHDPPPVYLRNAVFLI